MATLKSNKYFMFFLFLASSCNTYIEDEQIYQLINIENWKAKGSVKVKLYHYEKDTNFKKIIAVDSLFEVTNDSKYHYLTIIPEFLNDKPINDDMILLLNDSLEYRFTKVSFLRDTLKLANPTGFLGRKIIVRYNLKATVNEKEINYKDTLKSERQSSYISLDASLGKRIK